MCFHDTVVVLLSLKLAANKRSSGSALRFALWAPLADSCPHVEDNVEAICQSWRGFEFPIDPFLVNRTLVSTLKPAVALVDVVFVVTPLNKRGCLF